MKDLFSGYYTLSEEEIEGLWDSCIFVFDTNTLMNLYRYPKKTRELLLGIIDKIKDRVWIPYQIALEYHRNLLDEIHRQEDEYHLLEEYVSKNVQDLKKKFDDLRHSNIETEKIINSINQMNEVIKKELENQKKLHPNLQLLKEEIANLIGKNIGKPYDQQELDNIYIKGAERYKAQVPPGFADAPKKKDIFYYDNGIKYWAQFGDLIFWCQVLDKSKDETVKSVILVSDDIKEDWVYQIKGKKKGVHPQLIQEFRMVSGKQFFMYTTERFLESSDRYLKSGNISAEDINDAIKQIEEVKKENEMIKKEKEILPKFVNIKYRYRVEISIIKPIRFSSDIKGKFEDDLHALYGDKTSISNFSLNGNDARIIIKTDMRIDTKEFVYGFNLLHNSREEETNYRINTISSW